MSPDPRPVRAVLWDMGGVLTTSPFEAFARYESDRGLPQDFLRTVNATDPDDNAWARLERGELDPGRFDAAFADESEAAGHRVAGSDVLALLVGDPRPTMLRARWPRAGSGPQPSSSPTTSRRSIPTTPRSPRCSRTSTPCANRPRWGAASRNRSSTASACARAGVAPSEAVFLDDLGVNLKPARAMGMRTIKVETPERALDELAAITGWPVGVTDLELEAPTHG